MLIPCRTMLAFSLIGLFLTIATTSSGQGLQQAHPIPQAPSSGPGKIISRPFAHPTRQIAVDSPPVASDTRRTQRSGQLFHPASDAWKKIIQLIRQNAKLEAAVEKTEAVAKAELSALEEITETKLNALEEIAKAELRAVEERQATLKEQNERLQARVKELEQELNEAEQEMRERNVHAGHMERQMLQQTELLDELQRQLQQTRDQPSAREETRQRENATRRRGIKRERAVPPGLDRLRD